MRIEDLRKMRNRAPFRPFQIRLTTGEVLAVGHPEEMSIPANGTDLFVVWTDKGGIYSKPRRWLGSSVCLSEV